MSYSAVIFDLDGTLVDTIDDLTAAMNAALAHFTLPTHSAQDCKMMIGNGANRFAERALPPDKQDLGEKVLTLMREHYRDNCFENTRLYDGMGETVQQLRHRGLRLAMLTNKDQVYIHSFAPFKKRLIATISILGRGPFCKKYLMAVENISKVGY